MRKIIFLISFIVSGLTSMAQYPVLGSHQGSSGTLIPAPGAIKTNFIPIDVVDTAAANTQYNKAYSGALIHTITPDAYWYRNTARTKWMLVSSGAFGNIDTSIYSTSASFTGNRKANLNNKALWFAQGTPTQTTTIAKDKVWVGADTVHSKMAGDDALEQDYAAMNIIVDKSWGNENGQGLAISTKTPYGRNGWSLQNYSNTAGYVTPIMRTWSNSTSNIDWAYRHFIYGKDISGGYPMAEERYANYDSAMVGWLSKDSRIKNRWLKFWTNGGHTTQYTYMAQKANGDLYFLAPKNGGDPRNDSSQAAIRASGTTYFNTPGGLAVGQRTATATLDLLGTLKYTDGNQASGKVLTSDASGNATWQAAAGGAYIPITGTDGTSGPVTGDIELKSNTSTRFIYSGNLNGDADNYRYLSEDDDEQSLILRNQRGSYRTQVELGNANSIKLTANDPASVGVWSDQDFSGNSTSNAFIQRSFNETRRVVRNNTPVSAAYTLGDDDVVIPAQNGGADYTITLTGTVDRREITIYRGSGNTSNIKIAYGHGGIMNKNTGNYETEVSLGAFGNVDYSYKLKYDEGNERWDVIQ